MKKSELIELARKNNVDVIYWDAKHGWIAFVDTDKNTTDAVKTSKKLSALIKFLADNNIKINN